jgi:hypothetical protein
VVCSRDRANCVAQLRRSIEPTRATGSQQALARASTSCVPTGKQHFFRRELPALSKLWRELPHPVFLRGNSISSGESYRLSASSGESFRILCSYGETAFLPERATGSQQALARASASCVPTGKQHFFRRELPALSKLWRELPHPVFLRGNSISSGESYRLSASSGESFRILCSYGEPAFLVERATSSQ